MIILVQGLGLVVVGKDREYLSYTEYSSVSVLAVEIAGPGSWILKFSGQTFRIFVSLVHCFRTNAQNHGNAEAVQKMCPYLEGDEASRNEKYSQTQLVLNVGGTFFVYFYSNYVYFSICFGEKYMTKLRFWWNEQWALYIRPLMAQSKRQKVWWRSWPPASQSAEHISLLLRLSAAVFASVDSRC